MKRRNSEYTTPSLDSKLRPLEEILHAVPLVEFKPQLGIHQA